MDWTAELGRLVDSRMRAAGWSPKKLQEKLFLLGVERTERAINNWLSGRGGCQPDVVKAVRDLPELAITKQELDDLSRGMMRPAKWRPGSFIGKRHFSNGLTCNIHVMLDDDAYQPTKMPGERNNVDRPTKARGKIYDTSGLDQTLGEQLGTVVQRHAIVANTLGQHPNLAPAPLVQFTGPQGEHVVVEQQIEGTMLDQAIDRVQEATVDRRVAISISIARGLRVLHEHRIILRDLEPKGILIDRDLVPRLLDFEMAKFNDPRPTVSVPGKWIASPYRAPEAFDRPTHLDPEADSYSWARVTALLFGVDPGLHDGAFENALRRSKLPRHLRQVVTNAASEVRSVRRTPDQILDILEGKP